MPEMFLFQKDARSVHDNFSLDGSQGVGMALQSEKKEKQKNCPGPGNDLHSYSDRELRPLRQLK